MLNKPLNIPFLLFLKNNNTNNNNNKPKYKMFINSTYRF